MNSSSFDPVFNICSYKKSLDYIESLNTYLLPTWIVQSKVNDINNKKTRTSEDAVKF